MDSYFKKIILISLISCSQASYAFNDIRVTQKEGLFLVRDKTADVVTTNYAAWNKKWVGGKIEVKNLLDKNQNYLQSTTKGEFPKLNISFVGSTQINSTQKTLSWNYSWSKKVNHLNARGVAIVFKLWLKSPSFLGKKPKDPILLPNNKGWHWQTLDGQFIEVTFEPALAKLEFEKGRQKNRINAFFFTEIKKGIQQSTMTVKVSKGVSINHPISFDYDPIDEKNWYQDALPEIKSPVDLSFLNKNDLPAGKRGFIKTKGDKLFFKDGEPVKFWGMNLQANSLFKTSDINIKRHAKRIAQLGFNLVRLHHVDSEWVKPNIFDMSANNTQNLSKTSFKKLDWWIKCLKDEGVYIWLDLHGGRAFRQFDDIDNFNDFAKGKQSTTIKGFNYYNDSIRLQMQSYSEAYLSHINSFTSLAYKNDAAILGMTITNENDLVYHFGNALLKTRNVPIHNKIFLDDAKKFSNRFNIPFKKTRQTWLPGFSKIYLNDKERQFNQKMISHLHKKLKVKSLISTTPVWGNGGLFTLPALTEGNITTAHVYGNPEEITYNPRFMPSFLTWAALAQVSNKPFLVAEWNINPFPAQDRFTALTFVASIASLQDWNGSIFFGYSSLPLNSLKRAKRFSSYNDPSIMGIMPAAALLYRQGHVSPANKTYKLALNRNDFFFKNQTPYTSKTLRTLLETSRLTIEIPETPELPWLSNNLIKSTTNDAIVINNADIDFIPSGQNFVTSDTGELKRNWEKGIQTINTTKSQIASGWIGGELIKLDNVLFNIRTKKATVAVQSLVNKPIIESNKIFITAVARSYPLNPKGRLPFISEPVTGELKIFAPAGLKLYPITKTGAEGNPINIEYKQGHYLVNLADAKTHWYILK